MDCEDFIDELNSTTRAWDCTKLLFTIALNNADSGVREYDDALDFAQRVLYNSV